MTPDATWPRATCCRPPKRVGDVDISRLFTQASALHTNFYEGWLPVEMVADNLDQVEDLLLKLENLNGDL